WSCPSLSFRRRTKQLRRPDAELNGRLHRCSDLGGRDVAHAAMMALAAGPLVAEPARHVRVALDAVAWRADEPGPMPRAGRADNPDRGQAMAAASWSRPQSLEIATSAAVSARVALRSSAWSDRERRGGSDLRGERLLLRTSDHPDRQAPY